MRSRTSILLGWVALCGGLTACGETTDNKVAPEVAPLCAGDTTKGAPVATMAGAWTGTGTFQQTWKGKTKAVTIGFNLRFDEHGIPEALPALGFVSPWRLYARPGPSLRMALEHGGIIYAACEGEADGDANKVTLAAVSRCGNDSAAEWQYDATYRFADLLSYSLYAYIDPEAPEVKLRATDAFKLDRDSLLVRARATGVVAGSQEPVDLRLDAELVRGEENYGLSCRLGKD